MGLEVETLKDQPVLNNETGYKVEEELYETADGRVVRAGTGEADSIYRRVGSFITFEEAVALELITAEEAAERLLATPAAGTGEGSIAELSDEDLLHRFLAIGRALVERDVDESTVEKFEEELIEVLGLKPGEDGGEKQAETAKDKKAAPAKNKQRSSGRKKKG